MVLLEEVSHQKFPKWWAVKVNYFLANNKSATCHYGIQTLVVINL